MPKKTQYNCEAMLRAHSQFVVIDLNKDQSVLMSTFSCYFKV